MIRYAIEKANTVLVITHLDPDGDAIGSLTAMGQFLQERGKRVTLACEDKVPPRFTFLPMAAEARRSPLPNVTYDLVIAVDCGDHLRMGKVYVALPDPTPTLINIDHHVTNTHFGDFNLVDPQASATVEILHYLFQEWEEPITPAIATSLLTGLVTDTLGFRTSNTTARSMRAAADLMEAGADLHRITMAALVLRPLATIQLWGVGLARMQFEDGLAWTTLSRQASRAIGDGTNSNGLSNLLADIEEVAVGAVLTEMKDGSIRVSMRSREPYDVAGVAQQLGGGGHPQASGCTLHVPLDEAEALIVTACRQLIRETNESLQSGEWRPQH
jgi:phosphoesterase RecJ-like protein